MPNPKIMIHSCLSNANTILNDQYEQGKKEKESLVRTTMHAIHLSYCLRYDGIAGAEGSED